MTAEAIAAVMADLRSGRVRDLAGNPGLVRVAVGAAATGPVVDATAIYRSLVDKATPVFVYEDHPCISPPWERACVSYVNEHGNVTVFVVVADEHESDGALWEPAPGNDVDWGAVRWVTNAFVFIGGRSGNGKAFPTVGPVHLWQHAVYKTGEPADLHWVELVGDFEDGRWDTAHLTLLGALNFLNCRNVELVEPSRPRAEARRIARTGISVSEINVFPTGRGTRSLKGSGGGGTPLSTVRGHFASYGPDYEKGLLFGKYAGRFWHPQHVRGAAEFGEREHNYRLVPRVDAS